MKRFEVRHSYLFFIFILSAFFITGCGGGGETGHWLPVPQVLMSIEVTPPMQSIAKGTTQQFVATGIYSDNTKKDLTASVTWTSSNTTVATISNLTGSKGLASALVMGGPITITATDPATAKTGTATLTVTAAVLMSIGVTPVNTSVALGTNPQFIATGIYSDTTAQDLTSSVIWTSSDTAVATISNTAGSNGVATSKTVSVLPITITATDPATAKTGTAALTVTAATLTSIEVTPVNKSITLGTNQPFIATGIYSDLTTQNLTSTVTWSSSNTAVATISNAVGSKGMATSKAVGGPITITATDPATAKTGTATLTVTAATLSSITVTPVNTSIALGTNQPFVATGVYSDLTTRNLTSAVTWSSSNTAVATISNADGFNGLATPLAAGGPITITATDPTTAKTGTATLTVTAATLVSIAVTPVNPSIAMGTTQQFIATGRYSDATTKILTTSVTWTSSNLAVAAISNAAGFNGLATSLTVGSTTITATSGLVSGSTTLTVTAATLVSIAVTPINPSIARGSTQQFIATGTYTAGPTQDLTSSVTWTSSIPAISTISNVAGSKGLATSLITGALGPTTITATSGLISGNTTLTVTGITLVSIAVTPATPGIPVGATQQYVATGTYSDATTKIITSDVTWTTTPLVSPVATIDNAAGFNGLATALTVGGPITITATDPLTLVSGTAALTVTIAPNLKSAAPFGGFGGGAGMTNQGVFTVINGGDIGTTGVSTTMTGFHDSTGDKYIETPLNVGFVKDGRVYTYPPPPVIFGPGGPFGGTAETQVIADAAALDTLNAYNYLAGLPGGAYAGAGELGGLTLTAGTYTSALSFKITTGDLTLTGTANDIWVFQMGSSLTVGSPGFPRNVILAGGAQAKNVFWKVSSQARIEDQCTMVGTIIAYSGVTISTPGQALITTLNGRALATNASVTMVNTIINVPAP